MPIEYYFFFFQAEDGIRDYKVTGVQTCALPISPHRAGRNGDLAPCARAVAPARAHARRGAPLPSPQPRARSGARASAPAGGRAPLARVRPLARARGERGDSGAAHRRGTQPDGAARLFFGVRRRDDDRDARRVAVAGGNRAARLGAGSAGGDGAARGSGGGERGGGGRGGGAGWRPAVGPAGKSPTGERQRDNPSA